MKYLKKGWSAITVKEYLSQAFTLDKRVRSLKEQIMHLREQMTSVSVILDANRVQSTPDPDKLGSIYATIDELERQFTEDVAQLLIIKANIQKMIEGIPNERQRLIMTERYINLKRWEQIAVDTDYCWQQAHRIHKEALLAIESDYLDMI